MFDEAFGMATLCAENFGGAVRDDFGAAIVAEVLEPVVREVAALRALNEAFQRQAHNVDRTLASARAIERDKQGTDE